MSRVRSLSRAVVWHDLECGGYTQDLPLWLDLARRYEGPVLDIGAGTGRVTLALAGAGHEVLALDRDPELLAELERRAAGLPVSAVVGDARAFELGRRFGLCLVPMQTVQLLGGAEGRRAFLRAARAHLAPGGRLALAITDALELYDVGTGIAAPLPDVCERDGVLFASLPTAVRVDPDGYVLERRRETVDPRGHRTVARDVVRLDRLTAGELELEGASAGFTPAQRTRISATREHSGSLVVMLDG